MTLDALKAAIVRCADNTLRDDPSDHHRCARSFIARLSGSLESMGEKELADKVFSILQHRDEATPK